jgi:hypothetical protein
MALIIVEGTFRFKSKARDKLRRVFILKAKENELGRV